MKTEVQKILEMHKAGKITDEQAAALLEEVVRGASARRTSASFTDPIVGVLQGTWHRFFDRAWESTSATSGSFTSDLRDNAIHMSQFDSPSGEGAVFTGNEVRMSVIRKVRLERSRMTGSHINASKLEELRLVDSALVDARIHASSVEDLALDHSEILGLEVFTSKCSKIALSGGSTLEAVKFRACSVKDLMLAGGSAWRTSQANAASLSAVRLDHSEIVDAELNGVQLSDVSLEGCHWHTLISRGLKWQDAAFVRTDLEDVHFSAGDEWSGRRRPWIGVRVEDCHLTKVHFADCELTGTTLRNLTLSEAKLRGLNLSGLTLDGNEAFERAASLQRA